MLHLAIFSSGFIGKIFTGVKTYDGRFSEIKCAPYNQIEKGDLVLMKKSGGPVVGYFLAGKIINIENPNKKNLKPQINMTWDNLALDKKFWSRKKKSKYATLIQIKKPTKFRIPVVVKKKSLSGWISLGKGQKQIKLF